MENPLSASLLYERHRLSYPQIDRMLGTNHKVLYQKDIILNFGLIRSFVAVADALHALGVSFISLKGPLLSFRVYRDATMRRMHDIDLLISFKDVAAVYDCFVSMGYRADMEIPDTAEGRKVMEERTKHLSFWHPVTNILFEVHWQLFEFTDYFQMDFESIYQNCSVDHLFTGRSFRVMQPAYEMLYLLLHGTAHQWHRLKWLIDIDEFLRVMNDEDRKLLLKLAKEIKADRVLLLYNRIAAIYLNDPLLLDVTGRVPRVLVRYCIRAIEGKAGSPIPGNIREAVAISFRNYHFHLTLFPDRVNRDKFLKKRMISSDDLQDVKISNPLLLLIYRPIGYLYRHLRGV